MFAINLSKKLVLTLVLRLGVAPHLIGGGGSISEFIEKLVLGRKHVANMDWVEGLWRVPKPVLFKLGVPEYTTGFTTLLVPVPR